MQRRIDDDGRLCVGGICWSAFADGWAFGMCGARSNCPAAGASAAAVGGLSSFGGFCCCCPGGPKWEGTAGWLTGYDSGRTDGFSFSSATQKFSWPSKLLLRLSWLLLLLLTQASYDVLLLLAFSLAVCLKRSRELGGK
jgi:hypothetical protein